MAEAVRDLLGAFYNVLYKMFLGCGFVYGKEREGWRKWDRELGEKERDESR